MNEQIIELDGKRYAIREVLPEPLPGKKLTYEEIRKSSGLLGILTDLPTLRSANQAAARAKLEMVAAYLNGPDWVPGDAGTTWWGWGYVRPRNELTPCSYSVFQTGGVHFKTQELTNQAREILGDEVVLHSLGVFDSTLNKPKP